MALYFYKIEECWSFYDLFVSRPILRPVSISFFLFQAAVNAVTKSLSLDLDTYKILAVSLHPGWVQTDMGGHKAPLTPEKSIAKMLETLEKLDNESNGKLIQYDGRRLEW